MAATLLPRMETSFRNLGELAPIIGAGLAETGEVIGDLAVKGSEMMTSGPWRADFKTIMAGNNRVLQDFGEAGLSVTDSMRNLTVTSLPMVERFSQFVERSAAAAAQFLETKRATGELDLFFNVMGDTLSELFDIVSEVVVAVFHFSQALAPMGMVLLRIVGDLVSWVGELSRANPELIRLIATIAIGVSAFNAIGRAIAATAVVASVATAGWGMLFTALGRLAPSAIAGTAAMTAISGGMQNASLAAGVGAEKFSGWVVGADKASAAGEKVASTGSKLSSVFMRVGAALPLVAVAVAALAVAHDVLATSVGEAADELIKGGSAAASMMTQLQDAEAEAEQHSFGNWIGALSSALGFATPKLADATAEMHRMREAMDPLTRAQSIATAAQNDYLFAVERFGPVSREAEDAQRRFGEASSEVTRQQDLLKAATDSSTDAIRRQAGQILSAVEADIRYRETVEAATEAVRENGETHDLNTKAGQRNQSALIDVARAARDQTDAMIANGVTVDQVRVKNEEQREALRRVAIQMGFSSSEARRLADEYIGVSS
ncbi:MAG: hypothetical protein ACREX8_00680, partial [Gammaproteobacteria bacterium]